MNRYFLIILLLCECLTACSQQKPPFEELENAKQFATEYLVNHGQDDNKISLELEHFTDRLLFFDDQKNNQFILMARDEYAEFLNNRVLALSMGRRHSKLKDAPFFMDWINYYDKLLLRMKEGVLSKELPSQGDSIQVMPLLNAIRWRQFHLDNVFENQDSSVLYGCGAVAVGQLMKFYQWPDTTRGSFCYKDANKNLLSVNMEGEAIDWSKMKNDFFYAKDKDSVSLEPLMKKIGIALKEDYSRNFTHTYMRYIKRAMTDNFSYSPEMYIVTTPYSKECDIITQLRKDLQAGRPSIVCGGNHIFLCDGAVEDFLHFNMGWGGAFDGWYRFPYAQSINNEKGFLESAIINIMPYKNAAKKKVVNVIKPGTLSTLISEKEAADITELKVTGKINGADIRLIRRMAGYTELKTLGQWKGRMISLDLSDATIITDTAATSTFDARQIGYKHKAKNGKAYNFSNITDAEWKEFCSLGENNTDGVKIERIDEPIKINGATYLVSYKTYLYCISPSMFADCGNLQQIHLPKNTRLISNGAFSSCMSLKEITIPPAVDKLSSGIFSDCVSLEKINVCSDSPILKMKDELMSETSFERMHYNPNLRVEVDSSLMTYKQAREMISPNKRATPVSRNTKSVSVKK